MAELKYKIGQKVNYVLNNTVVYTGIITDATFTKHYKPYTIVSDEGKEFYANEEFLEIIEQIVYKGYTIELANSSHCALIYRNGNLVKCIAGDILKDGSNNRLAKAMDYCYKHN